MFKAETERMFQEANQGIIEIRKAEIDFYIRVSNSLGTQAALIGGFCYLTFSQNLLPSYVYTFYVNAVYYVSSAITIGFAIHVVIVTMLLQILGPGLALHGKTGSMVKAVDGMRIEQQQVLRSFFLMMFFFAATTNLLFLAAMDIYSAAVSTFFFCILAYYWISAAQRVYRRFYWDRSKENSAGRWRGPGDAGTDDGRESADEPVVPIHLQQQIMNPLSLHSDVEAGGDPQHGSRHTSFSQSHNRTSFMERVSEAFIKPLSTALLRRPSHADNAANYPQTAGSNLQQRPSLISRPSLQGLGVAGGGNTRSSLSSLPPVQHTTDRGTLGGTGGPGMMVTVNPKDIACEGFLTMNIAPRSSSMTARTPRQWERRYIVMNFRAQFYYYPSRQDYRATPQTPINPRPLSLDDFYLTTDKSEMAETVTVSSAGPGSEAGTTTSIQVEKFSFSLVPRDDDKSRHWVYKADTDEELEMWLGAIRQVCPSCFRI